jgi:ectoine hydroxylase-related dioxygenase (phytanoyl-CoA dioxygenase family)
MALTTEQRLQFDELGYTGPISYCSADAMAALRKSIDRPLYESNPTIGADRWGPRDQDCWIVYRICSSEVILNAIESLLGRDIILWNCTFFNKECGAPEVPWHQDLDFHYLTPATSLTAWLALDDATQSNGCLRVVPRTHSAYLPHCSRTNPKDFDSRADTSSIDIRTAVPLEMTAGEFVVFSGRLLHGSGANESDRRRLGLVMRYTTPDVKVDMGATRPDYSVYLVRGQDSARLNLLATPGG